MKNLLTKHTKNMSKQVLSTPVWLLNWNLHTHEASIHLANGYLKKQLIITVDRCFFFRSLYEFFGQNVFRPGLKQLTTKKPSIVALTKSLA